MNKNFLRISTEALKSLDKICYPSQLGNLSSMDSIIQMQKRLTEFLPTNVESEKIRDSFKLDNNYLLALRNTLKSLTLQIPISSNFNGISLIKKQFISPRQASLSLEREQWVLSLVDNSIDRDFFNSCSRAEILNLQDFAYEYFKKNNYVNLFTKLDYLITTDYSRKRIKLVGGYHEQLVRIKNILQDDFGNCIVLESALMSIIEYSATRFFNIKSRRFFNKVYARKEIIKKSSQSVNDLFLDYNSIVDNLCTLWDGKQQNFDDGPYKVGWGRPSVQHGQIEPKRLDDKSMMKLICLLYTMVKMPDISDLELKLKS